MKLYIIRHGKTYCNEKRLYCGKQNVSLSEKGILNLKELREQFYYPLSDLYFTSGAKRANETLDVLFPKVNYEEKEDLWEYDFGDFELKSYDDLKENKEYVDWILDKEGRVSCPNGESRVDFNKRVREGFIKFLKCLKGKDAKNICLITHGGVIVSILSEFLRENNNNFYELQPSCGQGYELEVNFYEENIEVIIKNKIPMKR
ncbi:MAG: histidine phosphatase family protein [Clostridium perfringens]|nr:histidine phosphatase family protein [Clostridium perfringens]